MKDLSASARLAMQEKDVEIQEARRCCNNVRRRLFVDDSADTKQKDNFAGGHKLFNEEYEAFRRRELEEAKKRWNFDFEKETPLQGKYVWVKVDENEEKVNSKESKEEGEETINEVDPEENDETSKSERPKDC